jgi:hypothetical protein
LFADQLLIYIMLEFTHIAHLLCRLIALPHSLIDGLLSESDLALLLKVLIADLFLMGGGGGGVKVFKAGLILNNKIFKNNFFVQNETKIIFINKVF